MVEQNLTLAIAKSITSLTKEDMNKGYPRTITINFDKIMKDYDKFYRDAIEEVTGNLSDHFSCSEINDILDNCGIHGLKIHEMDDFDDETDGWNHLELVKNTEKNNFDTDHDYFAIDGDELVSSNYIENLVSYYEDDIKESDEISDKAHEEAMGNIESKFEDYLDIIEN